MTLKRFGRAIKLAALLAPLALMAGGVSARPLDEVLESKVLRVVAYDDNKPFSWRDGEELKGVDVDLGRAIARELGVEAQVTLRMQGEKADDDLRVNIWKGSISGDPVSDVMLHVPTDREFAMRNKEVVIGNPYFQERVAIAIDPDRVKEPINFSDFKGDLKIGVKLGTVADYFLMRYENGTLINNIDHFFRPLDGPKRFAAKETAALVGVRSEIEGQLTEIGAKFKTVEADMDGIAREAWVVGMAVKENSRDLAYQIGAALAKLKESGELEKIFAKYGVTYFPPP